MLKPRESTASAKDSENKNKAKAKEKEKERGRGVRERERERESLCDIFLMKFLLTLMCASARKAHEAQMMLDIKVQ